MDCSTTRDLFFEDGLTSVSLKEIDNDECCICCRPYDVDLALAEELGEPVRLHCSHVFGKMCILQWTKESNTCPTCRAVLFTEHLRPPHHQVSRVDLNPTSTQSDSDSASMSSLGPIRNWTEQWYDLMGVTRPSHLRAGNPRDSFSPLA